VRKRLVEEFVAQHGGLVAVARRDPLPHVDQPLLALLAREQPRTPPAVVDVLAGLAAGSCVHVQDDPQALLAGPSNDAVEGANPSSSHVPGWSSGVTNR